MRSIGILLCLCCAELRFNNHTISAETGEPSLWSGLAVWWDVDFGHGVELSTSPAVAPTHWQQLLLVAPKSPPPADGDGGGGDGKLLSAVVSATSAPPRALRLGIRRDQTVIFLAIMCALLTASSTRWWMQNTANRAMLCIVSLGWG